MQLEDVEIEAQSIQQLFSDLSLSYGIPIGLQIGLNDDELAVYYLDFKKGNLSDLLTQFVAQNKQYTWEIRDGVVNVFPRENYRDLILDQLLAAAISNFSVKEKTSCWNVERSLAATPEIKGILEANGLTYSARNFSGFFIPQLGQKFTLQVSNMTLESILNRVIRESTVAKFWSITRDTYGQAVLMEVNARFEEANGDGKAVIPRFDVQRRIRWPES